MEDTKNSETALESDTFPEDANKEPKENNVGMAIVAYIIFFIPLLTDSKDDPFVKFHVKQGLVLFLAWVAVAMLSYVPIIMFFAWILNLGLLALMVIGIMNAVGGKKTPLPLVGHFAEKFNF